MEVIKSFKGFNKDMTCRGFQYEEGKDYETDKADACNSGFHACEYPLDVLGYYAPADSVYHEVEQSGDIDRDNNDTKIASTKIKIGASINIAGLVKYSIECIKAKCEKEQNSNEKKKILESTGSRSANSATGSRSANSATGDESANSATGSRSANSATGDESANSATGYGSANVSTGSRSANSATGSRSANSATGDESANSATGYGSANVSTGTDCSNNSEGERNISIGWGRNNKCKGCVGSFLVLSEWGKWNGEKYPFICAKMVEVDGEIIKADTWYTLKDGELVEVEE